MSDPHRLRLFRTEAVDATIESDLHGTTLDIPTDPGAATIAKAARRSAWSLFARSRRRSGRPLRYVAQIESSDCGAACLATVLDLHGVETTLSDLRTKVAIGRGGSSARSVIQAARAYGLVARGLRIEVDGIASLPRGSMLHWNLQHFVVLDHVGRSGIDVIDPAFGERHVPWDQVGRSFTGVALTFESTAVASRSPRVRSRGEWRHVTPMLRAPGLWQTIVAATLVGQLTLLAFPFLLRYVLDAPGRDVDPDALRTLLVLVAPLLLMQVVVIGVRTVGLAWLRGRVDQRLTLAIFGKLMSLPYAYLERRTAGDLLLRVRSTASLRQTFTTAVLSGIVDGTSATTLLVVVALLDPAVAATAVGVVLLQAAVVVLAWKRQRDLTAASLEAQATSQGRLVQLVAGAHTIKIAGAETDAVSGWAQNLTHETNAEVRRSIASGLAEGLLASMRIVAPLAILCIGAYRVTRGHADLADMVAATTLAGGLFVPISSMLVNVFQLSSASGYLQRVNDVFDEPSERLDGVVPSGPGALDIAGLSFTYPGSSSPVFADLTLSLAPGEIVAVMGMSGVGKSTFATVVAGLSAPTSGSVLLDGVAVPDHNPVALRQHVGYVPQYPYFFGGTIRENVSLFRGYDVEDIRRATAVAGIAEDIERLPLAYETPIVERGNGLSGGQLQRLSLGRALLSRPKVLILDEATSALDEATEAAVLDRVLALGLTTLLMTHRESVALRADRVFRMEGGRLVEVRPSEDRATRDAAVPPSRPSAEPPRTPPEQAPER